MVVVESGGGGERWWGEWWWGRVMGVRSLQERGGRIFLIGDLNYNNMYLSVISIMYIDDFYDAIRDNMYPLALKSKLHN